MSPIIFSGSWVESCPFCSSYIPVITQFIFWRKEGRLACGEHMCGTQNYQSQKDRGEEQGSGIRNKRESPAINGRGWPSFKLLPPGCPLLWNLQGLPMKHSHLCLHTWLCMETGKETVIHRSFLAEALGNGKLKTPLKFYWSPVVLAYPTYICSPEDNISIILSQPGLNLHDFGGVDSMPPT